MPRTPIWPGRRVRFGLFAASGQVDETALARARDHLTAAGHEVVVAPETTQRWRYFAGPDEARVAAINSLIASPEVDVLMAARGGYGASRILPGIDWRGLARARKVLVGFSDLTAISLGALARSRLVTLAGPMATSDFGNGQVSPFMEEHFWPVLAGRRHAITNIACETRCRRQRIAGAVWGGNLSLIAHLAGTRYLPRVEGGILFLEDIGEEPYAVERMFLQLEHAGVLARQRAVVLGAFTACEPKKASRYPYAMPEVVETMRSRLACPLLTGLPFGHIADKVTIPVGAAARLDIRDDAYDLVLNADRR